MPGSPPANLSKNNSAPLLVRCPACFTPSAETDAACRQCGFTVEMADQAFGIPPILSPPLSDLARLLRVIVVVCPPNVPLPVYAFWLFNRGSLFSAVEKGGDNHGILLLIDPDRADAVLMPGYGLEPFVSANVFKACLDLTAPLLDAGRFAEAAAACFGEMERQMTQVCQSLPQVFGLHDEDAWVTSIEDATEGAAQGPRGSEREDLF